jgi:hypothetical protein
MARNHETNQSAFVKMYPDLRLIKVDSGPNLLNMNLKKKI